MKKFITLLLLVGFSFIFSANVKYTPSTTIFGKNGYLELIQKIENNKTLPTS